MRKKESSTNKIGGSTVGEVIRGTPFGVPYRKLAPFLFGGGGWLRLCEHGFLTIVKLLFISLTRVKGNDVSAAPKLKENVRKGSALTYPNCGRVLPPNAFAFG